MSLLDRCSRALDAGRALLADARKIPSQGTGLRRVAAVVADPSFAALALLRSRAALRALSGRSFGTTYAMRVLFHLDVFTDDVGGGLRLPHPFGIVVGEGATIGEGCTLMHNVTIQRGGARVDREAVLATGSTLLAGSVVGRGAFVGAGSVVRGEIPAHSVAVGIPARVVRGTRSDEGPAQEKRS